MTDKTTPAARHRQKALSQKEVTNITAGPNQAYRMLQLKLREDKQALKSKQSIQAKIELKRELVGHYDEWINATLTAGKGDQDNLLTTLMLWHIDIGSFERALDIAEYAMKHDLKMPDAHQRTLATVVAEEIADTAKKLAASGEITDEQIAQVLRASTITAEEDMPDQVRAKLARQVGELTEAVTPEFALEQFQTALKFDENSGVKGSIKRLEKQLKDAELKPKDEAPAVQEIVLDPPTIEAIQSDSSEVLKES
ncbi:Phage small terminase subunit [Psychrobacter pacificensis]|uniref:Bacteriophage terminase endonuclease subunit n=1 Tax=Psychrobacter pacificensis TaxID=112002 RepID=A0A1G7AVX8_9GAMM|nr:phage terminase small subunit [Psychrobacter pacificensis]GLR27826.1 bacteriophage terminase endonuclease subunit [Psychrobacter pacificensis]GLR28936.1 bacteriophage terminase endonuclease subunit [Psychrobacter pacificensis]SDE18931.1 Phage small terminase subunit [Psychrobacter pacificensis]